MSDSEQLISEDISEIAEEALSIEILSALHNFTRLNIGTILGGISQMEFLVLYIISNRGELTSTNDRRMHISAIANALNVSTPGVSRLIKGLEEKGLTERVTDENDRRNTYVCLTESGKTVLENDEKIVWEFSKRVTERIGRGRLNRLCVLTEKLGVAVQEELALYCNK